VEERPICAIYKVATTINSKKAFLMNVAYINSPDFSFFSDAKLQLDKIITQLQSAVYANFEHGEIEQYIKNEGKEVLRLLFRGI
jgi:hypothetical protein